MRARPFLSSPGRLPESQWQCSPVGTTGLERLSFVMSSWLGMWGHHSHSWAGGLAESPGCLLSLKLFWTVLGMQAYELIWLIVGAVLSFYTVVFIIAQRGTPSAFVL